MPRTVTNSAAPASHSCTEMLGQQVPEKPVHTMRAPILLDRLSFICIGRSIGKQVYVILCAHVCMYCKVFYCIVLYVCIYVCRQCMAIGNVNVYLS